MTKPPATDFMLLCLLSISETVLQASKQYTVPTAARELSVLQNTSPSLPAYAFTMASVPSLAQSSQIHILQ